MAALERTRFSFTKPGFWFLKTTLSAAFLKKCGILQKR